MKGNTWLYSGLIVLVVALMIVGIVLVTNSGDDEGNKLEIPESDPVLVMDIRNSDSNEDSHLSVYNDGTIIEWTDTGPTGTTRTWKAGTASNAEVNGLFSQLDTLGFNELEEFYYPEDKAEDVPQDTMTDGFIRLDVDNGVIDNTVTAWGYFTTGNDPYDSLPEPLDTIYSELESLLNDYTEEVLTETIE